VVKNYHDLRFRIWRPAVAASDAVEKNSNIGAQLQSLRCTSAPNVLENLLPVWLLGRTNLFVPSHFDGLPVRTLTILLSALYSEVWKIFYTGAHLRSRLWTNAVEFSSTPPPSYMKWGPL